MDSLCQRSSRISCASSKVVTHLWVAFHLALSSISFKVWPLQHIITTSNCMIAKWKSKSLIIDYQMKWINWNQEIEEEEFKAYFFHIINQTQGIEWFRIFHRSSFASCGIIAQLSSFGISICDKPYRRDFLLRQCVSSYIRCVHLL